jgi:hypothetical protein
VLRPVLAALRADSLTRREARTAEARLCSAGETHYTQRLPVLGETSTPRILECFCGGPLLQPMRNSRENRMCLGSPMKRTAANPR